MKTEYRIIFTATFDTAAERDKFSASLKAAVKSDLKNSAQVKRADLTDDEYLVAESKGSEQLI